MNEPFFGYSLSPIEYACLLTPHSVLQKSSIAAEVQQWVHNFW